MKNVGGLFGSLEIGKRGMGISQSGQQTVGHNMSNVGTEGYSRQKLGQAAFHANHDGTQMGVESLGVNRFHDHFTQKNILEQTGLQKGWQKKSDLLRQVEIVFSHEDGQGLNNSLNEFFDAWTSLATSPESQPLRKNVLEKGQEFNRKYAELRGRLTGLQRSITQETELVVEEINTYAAEVARLNKRIFMIDARRGNSGDFRDERDRMVEKIAERIETRVTTDRHGHINLNVSNGYALISGYTNQAMTAGSGPGMLENGAIGIYMGGDKTYNMTKSLKGGALKEMVEVRDDFLQQKIEALDHWYASISRDTNRIYAQGKGMNEPSALEQGAQTFSEQELYELPLPEINSGTFTLQLHDDSGALVEDISIAVEAGVDTPASLVEKINLATDAYLRDQDKKDDASLNPEEQVNGVLRDEARLAAFIAEDGAVALRSARGFRFSYGPDNTGLSHALGFNSFFWPGGGAPPQINPKLISQEVALNAGYENAPGDNRVALEIGELRHNLQMENNTLSYEEYFNNQVLDNGLALRDAQMAALKHDKVLEQYRSMRDSVSAVNLDEELTNMVRYQRAYEASAKFIGTVDQMTQTLINM